MKKFSELVDALPNEAKREAEIVANEVALSMELSRFRKEIVGMTQASIADRLSISQSEVSRLEKRRDMLISTLRAYCDAVGAELHIVLEVGGMRVRLMTPELVTA